MSDSTALSDDTPWRFRSIKWGQVWRRQDHANLILTGMFILAVILVTFVVSPETRPWYIYDGKNTCL